MSFYKKKKFKSLLKNPYCHWCGRKVIKNKGKKSPVAETATIDHIYSKNSEGRHYIDWLNIFYSGIICNTVLACYECNQTRNNKEIKELKELRKKCLP